ncbi:glycosyltransferase family 4 protein [Chryseobacterium luquanense]|uniref:Glycosyltransferase family 4 protein n=1 Tax=Chryseobacterium luquanense TaxID=2983766 RepID=A0ABT3Y6C3_9FLAO|nr:glycosyltransferase family 4 protein [Chryseobacterium luquanense]MCX8533711.1 glycosyltransferase family 4 protein [Chryseobacterium luquanense]
MKQIHHVLFITKEFQSEFQENTGGTGVFYKNITDSLVEKNIHVSVFGSSKKPFSIENDKLSVLFVKDYFKKYKFMEFLRSISGKIPFLKDLHFKIYDLEINYLEKELSKFIENKEIDIIETHDWEGISRSAESLPIPCVIRCHGSWSILRDFFGYGAAKGKIHNEKLAFKNADNIITISQNNEKMVQQIFGDKNYQLIYNGIDTDIFKPQKNNPIIEKSIFYLGNISSEKGAETALNAFIKVSKIEKNVTLHFIGKETNLVNQLKEKISQEKLEQKVYFHGKKNRDEVIKLISQAEVVIFPSKGETFGLALAEAMALEKPVICSNLEAFKEIVSDGKNGLIAESEDEFADKICDVFSKKLFASDLAKNARKTIVEKFSSDKMLEETLSYYTKVINQ